MTKKKAKRKSGRLQKGKNLGSEKQRVKKYKRKQQLKKKGKSLRNIRKNKKVVYKE